MAKADEALRARGLPLLKKEQEEDKISQQEVVLKNKLLSLKRAAVV
jgi:hypothetical protein